jgi:site-specific recombinase XerD
VEREVGLATSRTDGQLHKLRHTYVTRLAAAGVPARTIMDLAGHEHLSTTLRYMHLVAGEASRAVAALESFDRSEATEAPGHHRGTAHGA